MADETKPDLIGDTWLMPPAIYADHFSLSGLRSARIVRLAFAEYVGKNKPPLYRVGIAMPLADAKELVRVLQDSITKIESGLSDEEEDC
jgi:hypothetical protein